MFIQVSISLLLLILLIYLKRRFTWKLLKRYESPVSGKIDVSQKYNGELVLMTNFFVQGVSIEQPSIIKSYWHAVSRSILKHCQGKINASVLFIGLGANTSSRLVYESNPKIRQTIVEIDPLIVQACRDYFHLDDMENTEVITADIFAVLPKKKMIWKHKFDCIVIDTFVANPPYLLHGSHDPSYLNRLLPWLKEDGMFLFNVPVKIRGAEIESLIDYLQEHFRKVEHKMIYDPRGYRNHFIIAMTPRL